MLGSARGKGGGVCTISFGELGANVCVPPVIFPAYHRPAVFEGVAEVIVVVSWSGSGW